MLPPAPHIAAPLIAVSRIAFQGAPGAFGEEAARRWHVEAASVPCATFDEVVAAVRDGRATLGVLPVENRIAGAVTAARAALAAADGAVAVVGELALPITLCLLALPGAAPDALRRVRSHPVALAQCESFFHARPRLVAEPWWDTAGAARDVAQAGDPTVGAIASPLAAERWGLVVAARGIADVADNWTRFVVVAPRGD